MYVVAHQAIVLIYILLPPCAVLLALFYFRDDPQRRRDAIASFGILTLASIVIGAAASIIYGVALGGVISPLQMALTSYLVAGLLCILKFVDRIIDRAARAILFVGRGTFLPTERLVLAIFIRAVVLFGFGLPYMIAAAMTYHPKVVIAPDAVWAKMGAQPVQFRSTDGLELTGLWIPSTAAPGDPRDPSRNPRADHTIILCHGQLEGSTSFATATRVFTAAGYNVLTFDFRGYGKSEGQMMTFGDLERRDVLGAVEFLQSQHPDRARHIHGIGAGVGAAALLAAAADPGPAGQSIESLVVSGCYDTFPTFTAYAAGDRFRFCPPLPWLITHVGIKLAGLQTGADLSHFSPAQDAASVSPRPIMFIHNRKDRIIPFPLGQDLFDAAHAPKINLWLDDGEDDPLTSPQVAAAARRFLELAVPML